MNIILDIINEMKNLLILIIIPWAARALECPDGGYEVASKSSYSSEIKTWCQVSKNGQLLKHGPEHIRADDGKTTIKNWNMGKEIHFPSTGLPGLDPKPSIQKDAQTARKPEKTKKDYSRWWPSREGFAAKGLMKVYKNRSQYQKEVIPFAKKLLDELQDVDREIKDNLFYDAFLKIPDITRNQIKNLSHYYLMNIMSGKFQGLEMRDKGVLHPLIKEFSFIINRSDRDMAVIFLNDFGIDPTMEAEKFLSPLANAIMNLKNKEILGHMLPRVDDLNKTLKCIPGETLCPTGMYMPYCTAMDIAARAGNITALKMLHALGASVEGNVSTGTTPLIHAIKGKQYDAFKFLLAEGADINHKAEGQNCYTHSGNPLGVALTIFKDNTTADFVLEQGTTIEKSDPHILAAALRATVGKNYVEKQNVINQKIEWTRSKGFELEGYLKKTDEPLRIAAKRHYPVVMRYFLQFDVDVNRRNSEGRTPVFEAFESIYFGQEGKPGDYDKARKSESDEKKSARKEIIEVIFNNKGKREIRDKDGKGLLHYCGLQDPHDEEIKQFLKDKGSW